MNKRTHFLIASLSLISVTMFASCGEDQAAKGEVSVAQSKAALSESVGNLRSYASSPTHQISPTYNERVMQNLMNRMRISPKFFELKDSKGHPLEGHQLANTGSNITDIFSWEEKNRFQTGCFFQFKNPQNPTPEEIAASKRTCCELKVNNGALECTGPYLDPKDTTSLDSRGEGYRRGYLNSSNTHEITHLFINSLTAGEPAVIEADGSSIRAGISAYLANDQFWKNILLNLGTLGVTDGYSLYSYWDLYPGYSYNMKKPDCFFPPTWCQALGGSCETEGECTKWDGCAGVCKHPSDASMEGSACVANPKGVQLCQLDNTKQYAIYGQAFSRTYVDPTNMPFLLDGIALNLPKSKTFGSTHTWKAPASGSLLYTVNVFSPLGQDPAYVGVVLDGEYHPLSAWTEQDTATGEYVGKVMEAEIKTDTDKCHHYYFIAQDKEGFQYSYPAYGSLGVQTKEYKKTILALTDTILVDSDKLVDKSKAAPGECLSYDPKTRPAITNKSAITSPSVVCKNGDTRPCFSGRDQQRGVGICKDGVEKCEDGRWNGICSGEVLPNPYEICTTPEDDNCSGFVNEGCPTKPSASTPSNGSTTTQSTSGSEKKGGCSQTGTPEESPIWVVLGALGLAIVWRRKR